MRISVKLTVAFLSVAALVAVLGLLSHWTNLNIQQQVQKLSTRSLIHAADANNMLLALAGSQAAAYRLIAQREKGLKRGQGKLAEQEIQINLDAFNESLSRSRQLHENLADNGSATAESELGREPLERLARISNGFRAYQTVLQQLEAENGNAQPAFDAALDQTIREQFAGLATQLEAFRGEAEGEATHQVRGIERALINASRRNSITSVAAILIAGFLGLTFSKSIGRRLAVLKAATERIASGDWGHTVPASSSDELGTLASAFNLMAAQLQTTTVSKVFLDSIIESMHEVLLVVNLQGNVTSANDAALQELQYPREELIGRPLSTLVDFGMESQDAANPLASRECRLITRQGGSIVAFSSSSPHFDAQGTRQGMIFTALNITDLKAVEEQLRTSLKEKETLLQEVHHRVKNNLQIISSLMSLQARAANDPYSTRMFQECQDRIRSMSLLHEKLYRAGNVNNVDFSKYLQDLTEHLARSYGAVERCIAMSFKIESAVLSLEQLITCGMIVNELVSNALKHAFPAGEAGEIEVAFSRQGPRCRLSVSDNGANIPELASAMPESLGMQVVAALVDQLRGELSFVRSPRKEFVVAFAESPPGGSEAGEAAPGGQTVSSP